MDSQNNQQGQSTEQSTSTPPVAAQNNHTMLAVLSYIGPLVIVSYLMGKDNEFVKFHTKQGLVLFGIEIVAMILASMMYSFWMIINIINLGTLVLSIIGIVNAVQGNRKELPLVGGLAKNINF